MNLSGDIEKYKTISDKDSEDILFIICVNLSEALNSFRLFSKLNKLLLPSISLTADTLVYLRNQVIEVFSAELIIKRGRA